VRRGPWPAPSARAPVLEEAKDRLLRLVRQAQRDDAERLAPNELIRAILCAPVDLLWNGGIGTYVKASTETDAQVGDRAFLLLNTARLYGIWNYKLGTADTFQYRSDPRADEWPPAFAPRPQDRVVLKNKPSVFFGTPIESFLRYDGVDTLVVMGVSTSGCVRAAVEDAFSHNFRVIVVEQACGDRSPSAHRANLFDMDMKFADVEDLDFVVAHLKGQA